ncbi:hypothetical protein GALL_444860 [mine drainage metagenome]|uniref:Uncharacterized protein n=1 Tax=mine drainage metagenome TaxID=410659 RepID=A0A1J5PST1_9ZZZZ
MVWTNLACAWGLKITSQKSVISMRMVMNEKSEPTGLFIQPFATSIHSADRFDPNAISMVTIKCLFLDNLSQPKKNRPIKVDSRKNAINPSIASGAPKMSPT